MSVVHSSDDWTLQARCRGMADALFPEGKDQKRARTVCLGCPVRAVCLAEALDNRIEWGVWGGLTERERRQLLRQRPDIESWAEVLFSASQSEELLASLPASVGEVLRGVTEETRTASAPRSTRLRLAGQGLAGQEVTGQGTAGQAPTGSR